MRRTKPSDPEDLIVASHVSLLPTEDKLTISDLVPGSQYEACIPMYYSADLIIKIICLDLECVSVLSWLTNTLFMLKEVEKYNHYLKENILTN